MDLVANTATFSGDLGKASGALKVFGDDAEEAGKRMDFSMREAKGSMMLASEELGVHIPRHLQALIATIPGVGLAFAEMLPIVGVVAAIAIIAKLIEKNDEAKEKLAQGWDKFGAATDNVLGGLDDKLLQVEKRADELAGRHLAALRKELELIDHQSMHELVAEFGTLTKAADAMFAELKSHWYEFRTGSEDAQKDLDSLKAHYDLFIAEGNKAGAHNLLVGALDKAKKELADFHEGQGKVLFSNDKMLQSLEAQVRILNDQVKAEQTLAAINSGEKANAKTNEGQAEQGRQHAVYEEQQKGLEQRRKAEERYAKEKEALHKKAAKEDEQIAEEQARATEAVATSEMKVQEALANEMLKNTEAGAKLTAAAEIQAAKHDLATRQATAQQALEVEVKAVQKMTAIEVGALDQEIAALNRHDAEYLVKLKQFEDKKAQIVQQGENEITKVRNAAEEKQFQDTKRAEDQITSAIASNVAHSILINQNMAQAFEQMGAQMLESAAANTIKMILLRDKDKLSSAEVSAAHTYATVSAIPIVGPLLAPAAAAVAFASVMAFEAGGEIPGSGPQPIIAHGGETVVTKALTDQVRGNRSGAGGHSIHYEPHIQAVDTEGVERMLDEHEAVFTRRVSSILRKQNKKG